jgi:aryl-alcohol dehydrogenase-like predicted oxidoreductase
VRKKNHIEGEFCMEYTKISNSDIEVSRLVMGCWAIGGGYTWGDQNDDESIRTVHAALDLGINGFDTAEFYGKGRSEEVLGKALSGRRSSAVILSKIWVDHMDKEGVVKACEGSLQRLNTDYIDVYMIHWPNRDVPVAETIEAMYELKNSGKVRAVGVSNFGVVDLSDAVAVADIVVDQLPYNLLFRAIEYEVLPACIDNQVPVMAYSPLGQGLLTGKFRKPDDVDDERARIRFYSKDRPGTGHDETGYEASVFSTLGELDSICSEAGIPLAHAAINWVLGREGVPATLVGARNPAQVAQNAECFEHALNSETASRLEAATVKLKDELGPNPDMWRTESRFR